MNNNIVFNKTGNQPRDAAGVLKVTALLYFGDALVKQRYEECPKLIATAKSFGATQSEIRAVIQGYLRGARTDRPGAVIKQRKGGRRRF